MFYAKIKLTLQLGSITRHYFVLKTRTFVSVHFFFIYVLPVERI